MPAVTAPKPCKDCAPYKSSPRPAPYPGPRCATHHRAAVQAAKAKAHESRVEKVYGLKPGGYEELYRLQGGHCSICLRATGATRKLSVDHDHATGRVRGLVCRPCNSMLGHGRDLVEFFERTIAYLRRPPAQYLLDPKYLENGR